MRAYIDLESKNVVTKPGVPSVVPFLNFKRSIWFSFEVQFVLDGRIVELPAASSGMFEIKPKGKFDAEAVAGAVAWDKIFKTKLVPKLDPGGNPILDDEGNPIYVEQVIPESVYYRFTINFITVPLDALFMVDLNPDNDVEVLVLMGEIKWIIGGVESKSQTFEVRLYNDVIREGDVLPALPPISHGFFVPSISSLTGGTSSDLDALPTVGIMTGTIIQILVTDVGLQWLTYLLTYTDPGSPPGVVTPLDYDETTNPRRWMGAVGPAGPTGRSAGARYTWSTDVDETDPTPGKLKVNAAIGAATELYISETDLDGNLLQDILASWDDGTSTIRGRIMVQDPVIVANFVAYDVTGTRTDTGDWDTFNITHVASGGAITNGLQVNVMFWAKGDKGEAGPGGAPAGFPYLWSTNTDANDPGEGKVKVNSSLDLATELYISETDGLGRDLEAYLSMFTSSSTVHGHLHITDPANPENFAIYGIFGTLNDLGDWDTFNIFYVGHGGTLTDDLPVNIIFVPAGDKGEPGPEGPPGDYAYETPVILDAGVAITVSLNDVTMSKLRTLTNHTTVTLTEAVQGKVSILHFQQSAVSPFTLAFVNVDYWVGTGGSAPVMSPVPNVVDAFTFWYDGDFLYGSWAPGA
jgi:hypothetical protein